MAINTWTPHGKSKNEQISDEAMTLAQLLGRTQNIGQQGQIDAQQRQAQHQADMAKQAQEYELKSQYETPILEEAQRHNKANELTSAQNAATSEQFRKDQIAHMGKQDRLEALKNLLGGGASKPLSVEQERQQVLANEGLQATDRLKQDAAANPRAHTAVLLAEEAKKIPLIGGALESGITGLASFFNPKANAIAADRSKVLQNMGYQKSGANVSIDEKREAAKQMPGLATPKATTNTMYDTFAEPFHDVSQMHQRPQSPYDQQELLNYAEKGGALPQPKQAPPAAPRMGLTPEQEARRQELLRKAQQ